MYYYYIFVNYYKLCWYIKKKKLCILEKCISIEKGLPTYFKFNIPSTNVMKLNKIIVPTKNNIKIF